MHRLRLVSEYYEASTPRRGSLEYSWTLRPEHGGAGGETPAQRRPANPLFHEFGVGVGLPPVSWRGLTPPAPPLLQAAGPRATPKTD
jgi:hypothetical protein